MATAEAIPFDGAGIYTPERELAIQKRYAGWHLGIGFVALAVGGLMGLMQAVNRIEIDLVPALGLDSYYQGLTLHGVLLVLVFTFAFGNAMLIIATTNGFGRPLTYTRMVQAAFWSMLAGVLLTGYGILAGDAVLFTFYAPLQASAFFYLGLVLVVISTWLISASQFLTLREWRREHVGERIPLQAYTAIVTYLLWDIASIFVAVEILAFLLPWTLGILDGVDPLFTRTLFWATGHAIVYVWLLPVYVSWYTMVPKMAGGRLYSDGLARFAFILLLLLSTPVGLHHQYTDPGIPPLLKVFHMMLTFGVIVPSIITFFTVMASLEDGGRARGGRGLLGWIPALPWGNPALAGQLLAMLTFILGGITGTINASATMNLVVHNTAWIPGHFHLTVGTAVALSIIASMYWMVPHITGRKLFSPRLALWQVWIYFVGMLIFARGQIQGGLDGMPRRTSIGEVTYDTSMWDQSNLFTAVGGVVMVSSGILFVVVILGTLLNRRLTSDEAEAVSVPYTDFVHGPEKTHPLWDRLGFWALVAVLGVLAAYLPFFVGYLPLHNTSPGFNQIF